MEYEEIIKRIDFEYREAATQGQVPRFFVVDEGTYKTLNRGLHDTFTPKKPYRPAKYIVLNFPNTQGVPVYKIPVKEGVMITVM